MGLKKIKKRSSEDLKMSNCVFCSIIQKEIPTQIVYEDSFSLAFLDIHPASKGHTLVIPKNHYEFLSQIPEHEYIAFMKTLQKIAKGMMHYTEGINILQNNGKDAGQLVPHVHFHIIPRRPGDGIKIETWRTQHDPDLDKVQKTIQSLLKD
ncbi:MAG: Hit-like protein involved in cell-cycle regulation [archaeon GW2011_AR17]|nr:MAG: Hit-like protein involved in cell-cycle regulation [archaeon GW2011_AR17]